MSTPPDGFQVNRILDYARRKGLEATVQVYECAVCYRQEAYFGASLKAPCPECGAQRWRYLKEPTR